MILNGSRYVVSLIRLHPAFDIGSSIVSLHWNHYDRIDHGLFTSWTTKLSHVRWLFLHGYTSWSYIMGKCIFWSFLSPHYVRIKYEPRVTMHQKVDVMVLFIYNMPKNMVVLGKWFLVLPSPFLSLLTTIMFGQKNKTKISKYTKVAFVCHGPLTSALWEPHLPLSRRKTHWTMTMNNLAPG